MLVQVEDAFVDRGTRRGRVAEEDGLDDGLAIDGVVHRLDDVDVLERRELLLVEGDRVDAELRRGAGLEARVRVHACLQVVRQVDHGVDVPCFKLGEPRLSLGRYCSFTALRYG